MKHNREFTFSSLLYSEQYIQITKKRRIILSVAKYEDLLEVISLDSERIWAEGGGQTICKY